MKRLLACLALVGAICQPVAAAAEDLTPEKAAEIKQLLELTGAYRVGQMMGSTVIRNMSDALRRSRPDIPTELFGVLADEVTAVIAEEMSSTGSFSDVVAAVYHKHFTLDEIRGLVEFYQTPLGRKLAQELPTMTQESIQAGLKWGQSLAPRIEQRVRARFRERGVQL